MESVFHTCEVSILMRDVPLLVCRERPIKGTNKEGLDLGI